MQAEATSQYTKNWRWWVSAARFGLIHLLCLGAIWTGVSPIDVAIVVGLYFGRMFFVTAGYHRYFSHRTYKMGRIMQFIMAFLAMTSAQKGVLWWASHHRHHHKFSDQPEDVHSVRHGGFFWAHMGWLFHPDWEETDMKRVRDLARFPELVWLDRHWLVPPTVLAVACFLIGGWTGLFVWFFWSTVLLWHGTFTINSLAHVIGGRRYETTDDSRNNFLLALLTCGEGWHNNHHHYQASANQGFFWWEIDVSYYGLWLMSKVGLVRDLRRPPRHVVEDRRHPVQQTIDNFQSAARRVHKDALARIEEFQKKVSDAYDTMDWADEAHQRLDEICEAALHSIDELKERAMEASRAAQHRLQEIEHLAHRYADELRDAANQAREELALQGAGASTR